jgi:hypothetical protein
MLPASDLSEILANLSALNLQPNTTAAVLAAVLAPLMKSQPATAKLAGPQRPARRKQRSKSRVAVQTGEPADSPRERAIAALRANPDAPLSTIARLARCARSTCVNARNDLAKQARKPARKAARETATTAKPRERATQFLLDALARGAQPVSNIEELAAKAHIDQSALQKARTELGVEVRRPNAGGVQAVCWSLPAPAGPSLTVSAR